jgi:hypothetical protein
MYTPVCLLLFRRWEGEVRSGPGLGMVGAHAMLIGGGLQGSSYGGSTELPCPVLAVLLNMDTLGGQVTALLPIGMA